MNQEELISALIGKTIGMYPTEVANILTKNGVVVNANALNTDELISATFSGLNTNKTFKKDFISFIDQKGLQLQSIKDQNYSNLTGADYTQIGTTLFSGVSNYLGGKSQTDIAKANANAIIEQGKTQLEIAKIQQQTELARLQSQNAPSSQSNTPLFIGLGVGGAFVIGLVIYIATKKK